MKLLLRRAQPLRGCYFFYIKDQLNDHKKPYQESCVPMGGELEYVDNTTLGRAIQGRKQING